MGRPRVFAEGRIDIGLIALTAPFVFAMWIFDLIDREKQAKAAQH